MSKSRFATFAIAMALMIPFGSTPAANSNPPPPPPPPNHLTDSRTLDLRAASSQLVVETIEDALRRGGLALFDEGFQLDSSLNWVFGETIEGEVDVVLPLWNGGRHVIFAQPGVVFWTGFEEEERIDGNIGVVYRAEIANGVIGGGSVFYDYDFQYGHSRIGGGIDLQSGIFQGALNYYHPLSDIEDGREGFVEEAQRGMDLRVALEREAMRVSANLGYWRFEGDEDVKGDWKPSYGFDAGIRIVPGVFLEGGWERHDETVSLDERWNAGLAFRFSLPGFEGASYGDGGLSSNLWKLVEREKRILYEERLGIPRVNLTAMTARVVEPATTGGSETVTIMADLGKPLEEDVTLNIMVAETSTAEFGADKDFTYGYKVYELDAATGEQSAPAGDATECMEETCAVPIPAGVTRFDIEAEILMTAEREIPEFIDFQIEVPEEHADLLRGGSVARVAIEAHGNEVAFAADAATTLAEDNETTGVEVSVSIDRPSPVPITLNVATSGTATEGEDYWISARSLAIPANASSASLTLRGIDNRRSEGSKQIVLTLTGNLPDGWDFASDPFTHTIDLQDDDLSVGFARESGTVDEPATDTDHTVDIEITQEPADDITLQITRASASTADTIGSNIDVTFSPSTVTFTPSDFGPKTVTLNVKADTIPEGAEFIELELGDSGNTRTSNGNMFSFGRQTYRLNINASDNTVGFASGMSTLGEQDTANVEVSVGSNLPSPITLNIATGGSARETRDYTISSPSNKRLVIPAGQSSGTIALAGVDDDASPSTAETIELTISVDGNLPPGWTLGSQTTHTVTLQDDDLSIGFERSSGTVSEPSTGSTTHTVDVTISSAPTAQISFDVDVVPGNSALTTGANPDVTYSPTTVRFAAHSTAPQTVTFTVNDDSNKESAEQITVRLNDSSNSLAGTGFSIGTGQYRLDIPANDNTVSVDSDNSDSTVGENGGTANVVVKIDGEAPANDITLNVSRASSSTAMETRDFTFPATLTIPGGSKTGMITVTGVDNSTEQTTAPTIVLNLTGTLPTGYDFTPSDPLTHTITINDDERGTIGWTMATDTHTALASGGNVYEAMVTLSKKPTVAINLRVDHDSRKGENGVATQGISQDYIALAQNNHPACTVLTFLPDDQSLTRTCTIWVTSAAAGKVIVMELEDRDSVLAGQDITLEPAVLTITVNSP